MKKKLKILNKNFYQPITCLTAYSASTAKILDGTIAEADIANSAVTSNKIADNAVTTTEILNGAVTNAKLATNSVDSDKIINNSVDANKLNQTSGSEAVIKCLIEENVNEFPLLLH